MQQGKVSFRKVKKMNVYGLIIFGLAAVLRGFLYNLAELRDFSEYMLYVSETFARDLVSVNS